jgi:hypothetical protein
VTALELLSDLSTIAIDYSKTKIFRLQEWCLQAQVPGSQRMGLVVDDLSRRVLARAVA